MALTLSCALATCDASHEHARIAESLGYARAWFYDSPALYPDVWIAMARAAERTQRIGIGPGVLVPSLRHPMVTAAAIGTLVQIAGADRIAIAIGSGFTGRLTMGQRPLSWRYVGDYVRTLKALLRGDIAEWEGAAVQMLQVQGFGAARPLAVPILLGAAGPKGFAVARELGEGVLVTVPTRGFDWCVQLTMGTVLAPGESASSTRALAAAGHAAAVRLHWGLEHDQLATVPNGEAWAAAYDDVPERERHLALHDRHLVAINDRDQAFVTGAMLADQGLALDALGWRERLARVEAGGVTEVAFQPAGPDVPRELEAFAAAAQG